MTSVEEEESSKSSISSPNGSSSEVLVLSISIKKASVLKCVYFPFVCRVMGKQALGKKTCWTLLKTEKAQPSSLMLTFTFSCSEELSTTSNIQEPYILKQTNKKNPHMHSKDLVLVLTLPDN